MKPSEQQNTNDKMRPCPMRAGRLKRLLLSSAGIVIAAAGTDCRVVDQQQWTTAGFPLDTELTWQDYTSADWDSYISP
ncbi:MAG: hypothetical protein JXA69_14085 [Phycisphaerae bacterium]|nr:hypothetical protein [Phycisphaerae bacterium]